MATNNVCFALKGITIEQFALLEENFTQGVNVNIEVGLTFGFDSSNRMVAPFFKCSLSQEGNPFIILEAACHFEIQEDDWNNLWNASDNTLTLPQGLATHFAMLTVGTARGILHAKTEKTVLEQYFIPTINLAEIITSEVKIQNPLEENV